VEEERPLSSRAGLSQLLRRHDPERETGVDKFAGEPVRGTYPALEDLAETDLPGVRQTVIETVEGMAVVDVRACTICPARRSSSANARNPDVWLCAWWNNNTSAISLLCPSVGARDETDPKHVHTLADS